MAASYVIDGASGLISGCGPFSSVADLKDSIGLNEGIEPSDFRLCVEGRILDDGNLPFLNHGGDQASIHFSVLFQLSGGKGGFGSMLRAMGSQKSGFETENVDACRDLSGRRLRHVQDEKKVAEWMAKQHERDEEARRKKQLKRERLLAVPKHTFDHQGVQIELKESSEKVDDAVAAGFEKARLQKKRMLEEKEEESTSVKRAKGKEEVVAEKKSQPVVASVSSAWDESDSEASSGSEAEGDAGASTK